MKKITKILAGLMAAILLLALTACGKEESGSSVSPEEVAALRQQVADLTARVEALEQKSGLRSWDMAATARADGSGAAVHFTAVPAGNASGLSAVLLVRLDGQEVASADCIWDGASFTASVDLDAADGYGYYCVLTTADGTREQIVLNTLENPVDDTLVYLRTSLVAYGNLVVESWADTGSQLTITSGYAQVQMPRLAGEGGQITCSASDLVLQRNGQEVGRQSLTLPAGEGEGSYEQVLTDVVFAMPEMAEGDQLELWLQVTLSTGEILMASGGSWTYFDGEFMLAVG